MKCYVDHYLQTSFEAHSSDHPLVDSPGQGCHQSPSQGAWNKSWILRMKIEDDNNFEPCIPTHLMWIQPTPVVDTLDGWLQECSCCSLCSAVVWSWSHPRVEWPARQGTRPWLHSWSEHCSRDSPSSHLESWSWGVHRTSGRDQRREHPSPGLVLVQQWVLWILLFLQ